MSDAEKPLVTFALFAYNQEKYIREAVEGAFSQTYEPLEIILSDDCSSDRTFEIMQEMVAGYKGSHKVFLSRNKNNLNIGQHVNIIANMANGQLIVLAAGDDISVKTRVGMIVDCWLGSEKNFGLICSDYQPIDSESKFASLGNEVAYKGPHLIEQHARGNLRVLGATVAVAREIFSCFPPLSPAVTHEDRVLPFRALLLGKKVICLDEVLVKYRVVGGISRKKEGDLRNYVKNFIVSQSKNTLPDAVQRLSDVVFCQPGNIKLRHACEMTISDHESKISLSTAGFLSIECVLLKWVFMGARIKPLIKHYLKSRFVSLFPW